MNEANVACSGGHVTALSMAADDNPDPDTMPAHGQGCGGGLLPADPALENQQSGSRSANACRP